MVAFCLKENVFIVGTCREAHLTSEIISISQLVLPVFAQTLVAREQSEIHAGKDRSTTLLFSPIHPIPSLNIKQPSRCLLTPLWQQEDIANNDDDYYLIILMCKQ